MISTKVASVKPKRDGRRGLGVRYNKIEDTPYGKRCVTVGEVLHFVPVSAKTGWLCPVCDKVFAVDTLTGVWYEVV